MATYHCSVKVISRSGGRSISAASAYRAGARIEDHRYGVVHDYSRRKGVRFSEVRLPRGAPKWAADRPRLWAAIEAAESRKDAQLAREVVVSLPAELSLQRQLAAVQSFVDEQFVALGMAADIAIHDADSRQQSAQPHAHILLTLRAFDGDLLASKKDRSWNDRSLVPTWRSAWEQALNRALAAENISARVDARSLEAQRTEILEKAAAATDDVERLRLEADAERLNYIPQPRLDPPVWQSMINGEDRPEFRLAIAAFEEAAASKAAARERSEKLRAIADEMELAARPQTVSGGADALDEVSPSPMVSNDPKPSAQFRHFAERLAEMVHRKHGKWRDAAQARASKLAQKSFPILLEQYSALSKKIEHFQNARGDEQEPARWSLNNTIARIARLQKRVAVRFLSFEQTFSESTALERARAAFRRLRPEEKALFERGEEVLEGRQLEISAVILSPENVEARAAEIKKRAGADSLPRQRSYSPRPSSSGERSYSREDFEPSPQVQPAVQKQYDFDAEKKKKKIEAERLAKEAAERDAANKKAAQIQERERDSDPTDPNPPSSPPSSGFDM